MLENFALQMFILFCVRWKKRWTRPGRFHSITHTYTERGLYSLLSIQPPARRASRQPPDGPTGIRPSLIIPAGHGEGFHINVRRMTAGAAAALLFHSLFSAAEKELRMFALPLITLVLAAVQPTVWHTDYDRAGTLAIKEKKDLLYLLLRGRPARRGVRGCGREGTSGQLYIS